MVFGITKRGKALEKYIPELLIATGVLYVLSAVNTGIVFVNESYNYQTVSSPLLLLGLLASILALIGISSKSVKRSPTISKATGIVAFFAAVVVVLLLVLGIGNALGVVPDTPAPLALVGLVLFVWSFAFAGITVLRASTYGQTVGILLIAESIALVLVFVLPAVVYEGAAPEEATIGIELIQAIILLWAGSLIRSSSASESQRTTVDAQEV